MRHSFLVLLLCLGSVSLLKAQTMFTLPFDIARPHVDVEIHHPATVKGKTNMSLFEGMYLLRLVYPIDNMIHVGIEQSFGSWNVPAYNGETYSDHVAGNTVLSGNFFLDDDTATTYQLRTMLALPLFNDGAERNLLADPWRAYRSINHNFAVVVEGTGAWYITPEFYAGATAGLEFYKYTGDDSVTDDPSGYVTLLVGGGYEGAKVGAGIAYKMLYYTGQTAGLSPFINALNLQLMLTNGIRPCLTAEIPLDANLSNTIPLIFNLRVAIPLGKQ